MALVAVEIIKQVDRSTSPAVVECRLVDAGGREWFFRDKEPVFSPSEPAEGDTYPRQGVIGCEILGRWVFPNGRGIVAINTGSPWDLESTTGETMFEVFESQIVDEGNSAAAS
jgi:hypothetical protein